MKNKKYPDMGKALKPTNKLLIVKGREKFYRGACLGHNAGLTRNAEFFLKNGVDYADMRKRTFRNQSWIILIRQGTEGAPLIRNGRLIDH